MWQLARATLRSAPRGPTGAEEGRGEEGEDHARARDFCQERASLAEPYILTASWPPTRVGAKRYVTLGFTRVAASNPFRFKMRFGETSQTRVGVQCALPLLALAGLLASTHPLFWPATAFQASESSRAKSALTWVEVGSR
jgi:hypothetical protein